MLKKAHISTIKAGSDAWYVARLAKMTSSEIHNITQPTGLTEGSVNYIRRKVGEELTGKTSGIEFETDAMRHGLKHEEGALRRFAQKMGLEWLIVQQLITDPDTRFGSTPDGLIILRESPDGTEYEVETVEVKCPPSYDAYISLFECNTPADLKKVERKYYWQKLDQMLHCGATRGHFVIYHPDFKAGNHKSLIFNYNDFEMTKESRKHFYIKEDLQLLKARKDEALIKFDQIRSKLMEIAAI